MYTKKRRDCTAGEPGKITTTNYFSSKDFIEFMAHVKNWEESVHIRLKAFSILDNRFRQEKKTLKLKWNCME